MERRLLLVFSLTLLVIVLSQPLLKKYFPQSEPTTPPQTQQQQAAPAQAAANNTAPVAQAAAAIAKGKKAPPAVPVKQAASEADIVVENDLYRITFTNRGGRVKSWVLKEYQDEQKKPLELVNGAAAEKFGYPLSLWTYDETQRNKINSVLYLTPSEGHLTAPAQVSFEYADGDVEVHKTFNFDHNYVVRVETSVVSNGTSVTAFPMWPAGFGDATTPTAFAAGRIEYQYNGTTERLEIKKVSSGNTLRVPFNWAGPVDQYFAAVFMPDDPQNSAVVTLRHSLENPADPKHPNEILGAAVGSVVGPTVERLYVGPKSLSVLEAVPVPTVAGAPQDLRNLVNFGFFNVISRPLFIWLKWTHDKIVPNWGWAIALQTLIINLVLLPLRISSIRSGLKMQRIQPQMNAIKDKYKKYSMKDPKKQEMQVEIGALMKQEGVNPVGGCLPMLLQMPFLFAYYSMLREAIDLRQASWLWIGDLSSHDPLRLLPIAIIITMFFTQRLTPQAGMDPAQQKMMNLMMPVMLGVISWNLAAGLCLYWAEGSLIGIVQQVVMNRTSLGREMKELAAKRARKKDK